jgi:DNA polymerase III subunit gamma/tau
VTYLSLYRKYRPQTFDDLVGQEHVAQTLKNALVEDRVAHAYLFTGPRGTGKTSTARILAKALNCEKGPTPDPDGTCDACRAIAEGSSLDVIEMDAASHSGVDKTREILQGVSLATAGGRRKVYVIDEVHMLSTAAFNALLKTLEEPPPHVVFVLATTEPHNVLATIVSRTQRFDFRPVAQDALEAHLATIAEREKIDIDRDALDVIARHAEGGVRDAISVLDQVANFEGRVSASDIEDLLGERIRDAFFSLFDSIVQGDVGNVFTGINSLIAAGTDARRIAEGSLEHARTLLLLATAPEGTTFVDASDEDKARLTEQSERSSPTLLLRVMDLLAKAIVEMRNAPNHRLFLEVALVRAAAPDTDPTPSGLLGRIERLERRLGIEGAAPPPMQAPPVKNPAQAPPAERPAASAPPKKTAPPKKSEAPAPAAASPPQAQEASSEPQQTAPVAPAPGQDGVGLGHVRDAWQATLHEVSKQSKRVAAYLHSSRPLKLEDGTLLVQVQAEFHESAMKDMKNSMVLGEALFATLGVRLRLQFVHQGGTQEPMLEPEPAAPIAEEPGDTAPPDPVELIKSGLAAEVVEERSVDLGS